MLLQLSKWCFSTWHLTLPPRKFLSAQSAALNSPRPLCLCIWSYVVIMSVILKKENKAFAVVLRLCLETHSSGCISFLVVDLTMSSAPYMMTQTWLVTSLLVDICNFSQFRNQDSPHMGGFSETHSEERNSWVTGSVCHLVANCSHPPSRGHRVSPYTRPCQTFSCRQPRGTGVRLRAGVHISWAPASQPHFPAFPACGFLLWGWPVQVLCSGFVVLLS